MGQPEIKVTITMIDAGVGASMNAPAESTVAERFAAIYRAMEIARAAEFQAIAAQIFGEGE